MVTYLQALKPEEEQDRFSLEHQRKPTLLTFCFWTANLQNCEGICAYWFKANSLWNFVMRALGKTSQRVQGLKMEEEGL
jgi:hypothetical protein